MENGFADSGRCFACLMRGSPDSVCCILYHHFSICQPCGRKNIDFRGNDPERCPAALRSSCCLPRPQNARWPLPGWSRSLGEPADSLLMAHCVHAPGVRRTGAGSIPANFPPSGDADSMASYAICFTRGFNSLFQHIFLLGSRRLGEFNVKLIPIRLFYDIQSGIFHLLDQRIFRHRF